MFELIGGIISCVFGIIKLVFELALGLFHLVFGLIGGIFSLILSLFGFLLAGALILVFVFNRRKKQRTSAETTGETRTYDVDQEEFTSFYDQFHTSE